MTVGSLFAGIGGFDLGFERAGFEIRWQVEIDPFCRQVLATHWPDVTRYFDVRQLTRPEPVDVICGGFPCQPHSLAGRRGGSADERDLWPEFARLIRTVRPRWVVAENVPGLLSSDAGRFFGSVIGDLAACGYDAEWDGLPASAFGARHRRDRVWLVAYPSERRGEWRREPSGQPSGASSLPSRSSEGMAHAEVSRLEGRVFGGDAGSAFAVFRQGGGAVGRQWESEPDVGRVAHGIPARVDRLRGLGNSIVPQIAQWIAERIQAAESVTA